VAAKQKMLITGVSGLLGSNLAYYFRDKYEIMGLFNSHPVSIDGVYTEKCQLSNSNNIKRIIAECDPEIIIHCASVVDIDECEADKQRTKRLNVQATREIVEAVMNPDVKLIYISTDAVYDGVKGSFSEDTSNINPQNYYGLTKYEGELEICQRENSLIFRTNIFGWNIQDKQSLGEWILGELKAERAVRGFKDAYFSSIYTMELGRVIDVAIRKNLTGVFNCGSLDSCSKYEFSLKIAGWFGMDRGLIKPVTINNHDFKAKRGKNLTLDVKKLQSALDYRLPTIDQSIEAFYRDYKCGLPEEIKKNRIYLESNIDFLPYGRQWIDGEDIQAVIKILRSRVITQGPRIEEFEEALLGYCGTKYAVAVNSGTSALHIACLAAGVQQGDEVITSPITFVASANCAAYCGAKPVFADIDKQTYNISHEEIEKKINERTKAVIPVHFAGQSCDMETISRIVSRAEKKYGRKIIVIEDASHALGSRYKNTKVGSCTYSDMATMSFHPVKHITTGEGGVLLTNDETLYKKLRRFRSHGITSTPGELIYKSQAYQGGADTKEPVINPWYYEQQDLGYNYRITDIQCALGLSQLKRLGTFRKRRREIVNRYNEAFNGIETIQIPFESEDCDSNFHLYVLLFNFDKIGMDRARFINELKRRGVQTQVHYIPVHTQPYFQETFATGWGDCPTAEDYYRKCLSMPLFPAMNELDIEKVINEITDLVRE
jgi:UDP-4-amino-4,6-dideoxy-N-acetyl-beta-L-altrosamine transaminase/dTDP-4-dehydrorhamnose reductase